MSSDPTDTWDGTIRHPIFEPNQGIGGPYGIRPERLRDSIHHVCRTTGMKITRVPAGQHYNTACETVVLHYGPWEIHVIDAEGNDIPMPTSIEGCVKTPVLQAAYFRGVYTDPLPTGIEREREIADFRLMLMGFARARSIELPGHNHGCLQDTLRVQLAPHFERFTP